MSQPTSESMQKATEITKMFGHDGPVEPWTRLLAEEIDRRRRAVESHPIRRGDVVQIDPVASLGCPPRALVVIAVSEDGFVKLENRPPIPLSFVVRIGRAHFYPDGTPVEP